MSSSKGEVKRKELFRILVVDDEVRILDVMEQMLKNASIFDCVVSTAESASKARRFLKRGNYDLIIADQKMPKTNGVELLTEVKENYPQMVRMLITGYSDVDVAREAINKADVDNFIEKPWDNEELLETIHTKLKEKYERGSKENFHQVRDVREAISIIEDASERGLEELKEDYKGVQRLGGSEEDVKKIMGFEFFSVSDFNKFPFELKHLDKDAVDIGIEDFRVYNESFTVTVSLTPTEQ